MKKPRRQKVSEMPALVIRSAPERAHIKVADEIADALLATYSKPTEQQLDLRALLSTPSLRGPTLLCASILTLQQLSGVNAVLFYSTPVLRPLLSTGAGVVSVGVTVINALMTVPAVVLVNVSALRTCDGLESRS
jgi:SP family facilitated glucose transporter-like MFS transporter 3